jgi:processive 1,2-diacylglycerol beta-glucosyltransferase
MQQRDRRVAILTASFGAGHFKAAQAVEQAMGEKENVVVRTKLIDSFISAAPRLTKVIIRLYLRILSFFPFLYGILYAWGNQSTTALRGRKLLSSRLSATIHRQLEAFEPHAVLCTHASPTGAACHLKKKGLLSVPLIAVITDFVIHRFWIYDEVDIYIVAHERVGQELLNAGVAPAKIRVAGIPIAPKFSRSVDIMGVRRQLGLSENIPAVLIMGGGTGALPMDKIVEEFRHCTIPIQLLVVTGFNTRLRKRLSSLAQGMSLHVFGFVDNIHELMAVADLIITKPGGLSSVEALAMGVPMILFRPIPGQEEGNAQFLIDEGVACRIDNVKELPEKTVKLLQDHMKLDMIRGKSRELAKPQAAQTIADIIVILSDKLREP